MLEIGYFTFESDKGQSIHNFAEELCKAFNKCKRNITDIFNDIELIVDQYENSMSLYWHYKYKIKLEKNKI